VLRFLRITFKSETKQGAIGGHSEFNTWNKRVVHFVRLNVPFYDRVKDVGTIPGRTVDDSSVNVEIDGPWCTLERIRKEDNGYNICDRVYPAGARIEWS
jgi:hypothetical protein